MTTLEQVKSYIANPGKKLEREVDGQTYIRLPIKTHFVTVGEDYLEIVKKYIAGNYQEGDLLTISEKIIALCQNQVIYKDSLKVGWLANLLSKYVWRNPGGSTGLRCSYKMQTVINMKGVVPVIFAAFVAAVGKVFGIRGLFYHILGREVAGLDGFTSVGFDYYSDKGILNPKNPSEVCDKIKQEFGIDCAIVDANDLGVEILGKNSSNPFTEEMIAQLIKDNPAGQNNEQTPLILIKKAEEEKVREASAVS